MCQSQRGTALAPDVKSPLEGLKHDYVFNTVQVRSVLTFLRRQTWVGVLFEQVLTIGLG